jgi:hypothetical protein
MTAGDRANEEAAQASAERAAIADLLEKGFLHVRSFVPSRFIGETMEQRYALARDLDDKLRAEGRETMILHRASVTRVYATRPKKKERHPA